MVWGKAGSTTLSSAGDDIDITSMTASKFNMIIFHKLASGDADPDMTFNNDSTSKYAIRYSQDGASDGTGTSGSNISARVTADDDEFFIQYVCSISGKEKLGIGFNCARNTAGAGNATRRMEFVFKYVPSPDADITRIDFNNDLSGSYDTGSNLSALGSEMTPASAVTFPTDIQVGSRAEITDTRKMYSLNDISTTGLKAYYKFDESSGNLINQSTTGDGLGSTADGTNTSVSYSQTGKIGNAYTYTRGTSKTVLGTSLSQFNFMHNQSQLFSINLWYKLSGSLVNVTGMIGNGRDSTSAIGVSIYATANGSISVNTTSGGGTGSHQDALITGSGVIPNNTDWHMLTITIDRSLSSSNWLTYIDGVLVATVNKSATFTPSNSNSTYAMELGTYGILAENFFGELDEFSIWNRVLTSNEISFLYNSGTGATVDNAKGWQEIGT